MWGSTIPSIYYGLYCDPWLQKVYWINVSVLASLCVYATLHPNFRHPTFRPYRAAMYAGLGLSAVVFVAHGIYLHGWIVQRQRMSLDWMALMATSNLIGAMVYAARVCILQRCALRFWDPSDGYGRSPKSCDPTHMT